MADEHRRILPGATQPYAREDMVAILMTQSLSTLFTNSYPDFWALVYQAIDD